MKKNAAITPLTCILLLTGCTHMMTFTAPPIPTGPAVGIGKGTAVIAKVADSRPINTEIFVFSNPPYKWIYQCAEKPEDIVHKLMKEALQRRGITESTNPADARRIQIEILDFSGHNLGGAWYVGKCVYTIRCAVKIVDAKGERSFFVAGNGTNCIARLSDENMCLLLKQTYSDFLKNLELELDKAGL